MTEPTRYSARIYGDMGDYLEVAPDSDGLSLIEISYTDGEEVRVMVVDLDMAGQLADALVTVRAMNYPDEDEAE